MKKQIKTIAILSTILGFTFSNVMANDIYAANNISNNNTEILTTLNKKGKKIIKKNAQELNLYISVMDLFENSPSAFYNLSEETKENFFAASSTLNHSLLSSRKKAVKSLAPKVDFNKEVSKFIWNVKEEHNTVIKIDEVQDLSNTSI